MRNSRFLVLTCFLTLLGLVGYGQPGDPGGGGNPTVPITGIEFLLGGGVAIGLRTIVQRIRSNKK